MSKKMIKLAVLKGLVKDMGALLAKWFDITHYKDFDLDTFEEYRALIVSVLLDSIVFASGETKFFKGKIDDWEIKQ